MCWLIRRRVRYLGSHRDAAPRNKIPIRCGAISPAIRRCSPAITVKPRELKVLSQVNLLGKITAPRHFLFILNAIRQAVEAEEE